MRKWWTVVVALALVLSAGVLAAQDGPRPDGYFLSPDGGGVWQVWRLRSGATSGEQLTSAPSSVLDYDISPDSSSVAYSSAGQLWLQRLGGGAPTALATLNADPAARPVFSRDGGQIAYADGGIWLVSAGGGDARQVFADPVPGRATPDSYPFYQPQAFVDAQTLLVDVGVWEGNTVGVLDLNSGNLRVLDAGVHHDALSLRDGRLLLFGNGGVSGEANLQIAPVDDLNQRETIVDLTALSPDKPLFVEQAVMIAPNTVRVLGTTFESAPEYRPLIFHFTVDIAARAVTSYEMGLMTLNGSNSGQTLPGPMTPDGTLLAFYRNAANRADAGAYGLMAGELALQRLVGDGSSVTVAPSPAAAFQWGPVGSRG